MPHKLAQKSATVSQIARTPAFMVFAVVAMTFIFYPAAFGNNSEPWQKSPFPYQFFSVTDLEKRVFSDCEFIFSNADLAGRKNILTDLYSNQFITPYGPAPVPKPHYTIVAKKTTVVTAYSSTPDQTDSTPFITAMGTHVRDGILAANFLKFGTKVRLPEVYGDKIFVVEDRMAAFNRKKLDIWMGSRQEALNFGAKRLTVEIVEELN